MPLDLHRAVSRLGPHSVLLGAATVGVISEALRLETGSELWLVLSSVVAALALAGAWKVQDELRLLPVLLIALAYQVSLIAVHELAAERGDQDVLVFSSYGSQLLDGTYPESEYPVGAVLLFALEALIGVGTEATPNRLVMVPFQLLCVVSVWSLRTRYSSWLAALLAIWPTSAYYWQYRFDLVPAALIVAGLVLAHRGRWGWSGVVLGAGAAVKWSPALSFVVLVAWLAAGAQWRALGRAVAGFAGFLVVVHVPFLLWSPDRVLDAYRSQSGRAITNESIWFFPLSALGLTGPEDRMWAPAGAPSWADAVAVLVQMLVLALIVLLAIRGRRHPVFALALAALAPALLLLTNKVFSAQFLLIVTCCLAFAGALTASSRREELLLGLLLITAMFANAFVYPFEFPIGELSWRPASAVMYAAAVLAAGIVLVRAVEARVAMEHRPGTAVPSNLPDDETIGAALRRWRRRAEDQRMTPVPSLSRWVERGLGWATIGLIALFAIPTIFVAVVLPYRYWDSLAFGAWSKSIAETGSVWANAGVLDVSRPLFYVPQGLMWRFMGGEPWTGRLLSVAFAAALVAAVWILARALTEDRTARALLPPLAVGLLVSSSVFVGLVAAGMSDVPVAAATATTAVALLSPGLGRARIPLVALFAAAAILAKASGPLGILGLALGIIALRGRRSRGGLVGLAIGVSAALAYDAWQASRLDVSFASIFRASNEGFWLERGIAARWDALGRAEWLGEAPRMLIVFGLVHGLARALGARPRIALGIAALAGILWSVIGPAVADGDADYPFTGSVLGLTAWLLLAGAMVMAPLLATHDPIGRRMYAALILWVAPTAVIWAWQRADEVRHLAPVWAPLILLAAAAACSISLALAKTRPLAVLVPAAGIALLAVANVPSIDGLGRSGWRDLLELRPSGWSSQAAVENFAYGPFSYELNLARENVRPGERVMSTDGRLAYFFPGRLEFRYPRTCAELEGTGFFSLHVAGESAEFARRAGQPTNPLGWLQCTRPRLRLVGEHEGIFAAFVVDRDPARPSTLDDCRITMYESELSDAVFGARLSYVDAKALRDAVVKVGYQGVKLERTGCSEFRVVVSGVPPDPDVYEEFTSQAARVGFDVTYVPAVRYPEVPADVPPVE